MWILGGVESPREIFFFNYCAGYSAKTLTEIVLARVYRGSIIVTDEWKGYSRLSNYCEHYTVNHSQNYVDPQTGATTNSIKVTWNGV